ncbi:MAG: MarR family winged helix-turn-helix transcriptional regulator [Flectobacillus sp.]|uniref:MarR family winged helix-turn-helix transcriptional regulator n=1 Tax=Flectobacillus sp. TaxID=50419 RepID=UPI003B99685F
MSIEKDIKQKSFTNPYQKLTVNIMYTNNWLVSEFSQIIKPYTLSEQQYSVLKILQNAHPTPLSINTIIENMRDQMSNVSRLVDKLEQKGYVERRKSPSDKRVVEVIITDEGVQITDEINELIEVWETQSIQMCDEDLKLLQSLIQKLQE